LEPTKPYALCSRLTGRISRILTGVSSDATAGEGARRTPSARWHRQNSLLPFSLPPSPGLLHDGPPQHLVPWQLPDEPVTAPMLIKRATAEHKPVVLGLIEEAAEWLKTKETNQWAEPWPTEEERDKRVLTGLQNGKTWLVWDGDIPAATVTIASKPNPDVWQNPACTCDLSEKAIYVHRLITARSHAGTGLGTELINWAGLRGKRKTRARWIRIDVWESNQGLHAYYKGIGFAGCGRCPDPFYPSGALFQKPTYAISKPARPQFTEDPHLVVRADRQLVGALRSAG
jgi:GNAT superfamily N-acetyltransferase